MEREKALKRLVELKVMSEPTEEELFWQNKLGKSALHYAVDQANEEAVRLLIELGGEKLLFLVDQV